jgi:hypothetical protein
MDGPDAGGGDGDRDGIVLPRPSGPGGVGQGDPGKCSGSIEDRALASTVRIKIGIWYGIFSLIFSSGLGVS